MRIANSLWKNKNYYQCKSITLRFLKYLGVVKFSINIIVKTCLQVLTIIDYMINDYFILVYIIYTTIIKRSGLYETKSYCTGYFNGLHFSYGLLKKR